MSADRTSLREEVRRGRRKRADSMFEQSDPDNGDDVFMVGKSCSYNYGHFEGCSNRGLGLSAHLMQYPNM